MPVLFSRVSEETAEKAKKMAADDVRSISNLIAYLVEKEWLRRQESDNQGKPDTNGVYQ